VVSPRRSRQAKLELLQFGYWNLESYVAAVHADEDVLAEVNGALAQTLNAAMGNGQLSREHTLILRPTVFASHPYTSEQRLYCRISRVAN
jgi:hypothetical protein